MAKKKAPPVASARTVQRLRQRLKEAEDTLNAIRDGHVEALVVRAEDGEQIFTLRTADQPFRLMVEQMREGAMTLSAEGTILYCNQRFADLMALPPERIPGQSFSDFIEPANLPALRAMLGSETYRAEFQLLTPLGTAHPAQLSSTRLMIDGLRTVAVVVTDLTHERTERGLRESNRLKDEFLATLSHELRTPLNVILGWTRMLMSGQLNEAASRHALELIDRNAVAQARLVNDLVDMSRMTVGKLRVELKPLPLGPALEIALDSVRPAAHGKGLVLRTDWKDEDISVLADATRLQQVLWNLLSNAVKFTPAGGRITVKATHADNRIRIEVSDTGIGIEPAFLPHVFDRFRQADSATTRKYGGLGIGLAIVHDLVRLHGGDIEVESAGVGKGTTFTVTLRSSAEPRGFDERRQPSRATESLAGRRIMVVEDRDVSRGVLAQALENSGAAVAAFGRASDAFAALDTVLPAVIVADLGLPEEDGYAFIRRVRAHSVAAIQSVPAIAVTPHASPPDRARALAVGFQQHFAKPVDPDHVIDAIHELLRHAGTVHSRG